MPKPIPNLSLEYVFSKAFETPASPLQRAICRAAEGRPIGRLLSDTDVRRYFGCERTELGRMRPRIVELVCGIRGGKSLIGCAAVTTAALTANLSALKPHEVARCSIVSATQDNADASFTMLCTHWQASPLLSKMIVGVPTADTLTLRRPDGRKVEIVVIAAHMHGATLRSRWQVCVVIEEAPLIGVEATGAVVTAEGLRDAAETRLVPNGQVWLIGSPYGPSGLMYDVYSAHFGKPKKTLVVHAPTLAMVPTFDKEIIDDIRADRPDTAAREYDAEWVDSDLAFLDGSLISAAVRTSPLEEPPIAGASYVAAMDPATRGNAWTLVVGRPASNGRLIIALAREWKGSKKVPLNPAAVLAEIAGLVKPYGVHTILTDDWSVDSLRSIASPHKLALHGRSSSASDRFERYDALRTLLATERIVLPPVPALAADLKGVRKVATSGAINIVLPKTSNGRHSDYAPSVALVAWGAPHAESLSRREMGPGARAMYAGVGSGRQPSATDGLPGGPGVMDGYPGGSSGPPFPHNIAGHQLSGYLAQAVGPY